MANNFLFRYFIALTLLISHFNVLWADQSSPFSFKNFVKDPGFDSNIALYGDAKVVNDEFSVQLTNSFSSSAGRIMYKKPIKLVVEGEPRTLASFSTNFSFSMFEGSGGDGLAFVMVPSALPFDGFGNSSFGLSQALEKDKFRVIAIEFDTFRDDKYGDLNDNHVGIDVGSLSSAKVSNISSHNMWLNSGKKMTSWIDYEAGSKRLEVRLSHSGGTKPVDPLLSYPIDLSKMLNDEEVFMGLSSSTGNSTQICSVYSWSFNLRRVPHWMHSQPLDPEIVGKNTKTSLPAPKRTDCLLRVLAALILGAACGALGASIMLYLWTIFANRRPVVPVTPEECTMHRPVDFEYKKVIAGYKVLEDGKKVDC
ncbi:probable L-type lectin-domain containing receptor kinase S.7 [Mangifera indica]|uniref:probable L-type lectin-domain containing receptor kinase S.7 n=1 Tax=Mangifera indica TaxID=29780 RepID=UPI001CFA4CCD|nr:probable L-type lectin-domain containing receptor kinase S.7 [Mangifera indica]